MSGQLPGPAAPSQSGDRPPLPIVRKTTADFDGNLERLAREAIIQGLSGEEAGFQEATAAQLEVLRRELLGESPTPIERLLVDRIVACWLQVQDAEIRYARELQGERNLWLWEFHQRRCDACHRNYLAAIKALVLVRKLAAPLLQVNVAERQINVAGTPHQPPGNTGSVTP